ncbi:DUF481 domain-containing protein [Sulfurimonas sp.]
MKKILLSTALIASFALGAQAADANQLVTHTELGYIQTNGNTDTKAFNLDANAKKAWGKHQFSLKADAQYGSADDKENKKKYLIEANYDYAITNRFGFNYLVGYKSDIYAGFDYQFYTGPGAKFQAIKTEKQNLALTANILYSQDKYHDATSTINDYTGYRAQGVYNWNIKKDLKFTQELAIRGDFDNSDNYFAHSKTAIITKLSDIFSAGLSYKVDYMNRPLAGLENKDTTFTANLIMDY